jgi:hypothetical protein
MADLAGKTLLVGIGAQKAGTTWLWSALSSHPDVWMSPHKELHYWDSRFRPELCGQWDEKFAATLRSLRESRSSWDRLRSLWRTDARGRRIAVLSERLQMVDDEDAYMRFFRRRVPAEKRVFGEITPSYSLLPAEGFRRLRAQHDRVKVVLLLRDPVARFWSGVCHEMRSNKALSPLDGFDAVLRAPRHVERTRYDRTLEALDAAFDEQDVLIAFYESLFNQEAMDRITTFLNIRPCQPPFDERVNAAHTGAPRLPPEYAARLREAFEPVYDDCRRRFGDKVPAAWNG